MRRMKVCSKCHEPKPLDAFYADRRKSDGLRSQCKDCGAAYRQSQARKDSLAKYNASDKGRAARRRYGQTPKGVAAVAKYRTSDSAIQKKAAASYVWNRSPSGKASFAKYAQSLKGRIAAANRQPGRWRFTAADRRQQYIDQLGVCLDCLKPLPLAKLESDHDLPVQRGGRNDFGNLILLCRNCNASKHTKTYAEWQDWKSRVN